jgi:hypothetical protein
VKHPIAICLAGLLLCGCGQEPPAPQSPSAAVTPLPGPVPGPTAGQPSSPDMTPAQIKARDAYLAEGERKDRKAARTLDGRFTLSERQRMDYHLVKMQDQAGAGEALGRANRRFCRKYHLTDDEMTHLMVEGEEGNWPLPPH